MYQDSNWFYLRNPFDNTTKGNFKRMMLLSRDHYDKLSQAAAADPSLQAVLLGLKPSFDTFHAAYVEANLISDKRQSLTFQLERLFAEQQTVIEDWDIRILFKYRPATVEYRYLMGDGRTSFYAGGYEQRLATVKLLLTKLPDYPLLADVEADVDAWLAQAQAIRSLQQGEEGRQQRAQKDIESARNALAQKMHLVFANLLVKYNSTPVLIENFYELQYLQRASAPRTANTPSGGGANGAYSTTRVPAQSQKTLLNGSFSDSDVFELKNTGSVTLFVWLSGTESSIQPADASFVSPGDLVTFYGDELNDGSSSLRFLIAANADGTEGVMEAAKLIV